MLTDCMWGGRGREKAKIVAREVPRAREHTVQRYSFKETGGDRELVWGHVQFEVLIKHSNIASWQLDIEPLSGKSFDMQI